MVASACASRVVLRIKYKTKLVSAVQRFAALLIFNTFCNFLRLGNSAWDFFFFWGGGGGLMVVGGLRDFLGFDTFPHSITPVT